MLYKIINKKLDEINNRLSKSNIFDLTYILGSKKEIIKRNFLAGVSRGVGIGIGITIITAIIVYIMQRIIRLNIPIIGDYISDIIEIVENKNY